MQASSYGSSSQIMEVIQAVERRRPDLLDGSSTWAMSGGTDGSRRGVKRRLGVGKEKQNDQTLSQVLCINLVKAKVPPATI
jgi:hypothetical protein